VVLGREPADVTDVPEDLGNKHRPKARQRREGGAGGREGITHLSFVPPGLPIELAQVGQ
jgi:hypothetical protein